MSNLFKICPVIFTSTFLPHDISYANQDQWQDREHSKRDAGAPTRLKSIIRVSRSFWVRISTGYKIIAYWNAFLNRVFAFLTWDLRIHYGFMWVNYIRNEFVRLR